MSSIFDDFIDAHGEVIEEAIEVHQEIAEEALDTLLGGGKEED